jgi:gas vesicle protein
MHAALRTCAENLKQFKLKSDRLTTEIEELYGFDGTKQLNIILSSVHEKTMRDIKRTKERKFRKYAQTLDNRYKNSDKSMEYDNTKITTNDTFHYNAEINGQKCMNQVQNTHTSKTESNGNVFSYVGNQVRRIVIPKTNPK